MPALPPVINDATVTLTFGAAGIYYGYCTVADVAYEFPGKDSYSTLTNSIVAQEITYAANELQLQIDHYYVMPYAGTNAAILLSLRQMNAWLATANLINRYFSGSEPDLSPAAAERRAWAELKVMDLVNGVERWDTSVGGDATPRGMLPVYQIGSGATITPSPNDINPLNTVPVFSMGRAAYRRNDVI